jgi:hypothetical protein
MASKSLLKYPIEKIPDENPLFFWVHSNDFRKQPKNEVPFPSIRYVGDSFSNFWSKYIDIEDAKKLNQNPDFIGMGEYFGHQIRNPLESIKLIKFNPKSNPKLWNITVNHSPSKEQRSHCDVKWEQELPKRPDRNEIRIFLAKIASLTIKPSFVNCPKCKSKNNFENLKCSSVGCNHEFK